VDARADTQKLDIAAHDREFTGDTGYPNRAVQIAPREHPLEGSHAALTDDFGHLRYLSPGQGAKASSYAANETERVNAISDNEIAGLEPFFRKAPNLVATKSGGNCHNSL